MHFFECLQNIHYKANKIFWCIQYVFSKIPSPPEVWRAGLNSNLQRIFRPFGSPHEASHNILSQRPVKLQHFTIYMSCCLLSGYTYTSDENTAYCKDSRLYIHYSYWQKENLQCSNRLENITRILLACLSIMIFYV